MRKEEIPGSDFENGLGLVLGGWCHGVIPGQPPIRGLFGSGFPAYVAMIGFYPGHGSSWKLAHDGGRRSESLVKIASGADGLAGEFLQGHLWRDVDERKSQLLPFVEAPEQRTDPVDAELAYRQSHLGRGGLAGAGTEENNIAVAGNVVALQHELVRRKQDGSGEGARIGKVVQRMAEVDNVDCLLAVEHLFELAGIDSG